MMPWVGFNVEYLVTNYFHYGLDIWSVGLLILYILFGNQPYQLTKEEIVTWGSGSLIRTNWYLEKVKGGGK